MLACPIGAGGDKMESTIRYLEIAGSHYSLGQQLGRASAAFMHERLVNRTGWKKA